MKTAITIALTVFATIAIAADAINFDESSIVGFRSNYLHKGRNIIPMQFEFVDDAKATIDTLLDGACFARKRP